MSDLAGMLGELSDCLDGCLEDDVAPAQVEADAQNRSVLARRGVLLPRKRDKNDHELGKITLKGAAKVGGKIGGALGTAAGVAGAFGIGGGLTSACAELDAKRRAQAALFAKFILPHIKIKCVPCGGTPAMAAQSVAGKIAPEMKRVAGLMARLSLQTKATHEHNKRKADLKWKKDMLRLLARVQAGKCRS